MEMPTESQMYEALVVWRETAALVISRLAEESDDSEVVTREMAIELALHVGWDVAWMRHSSGSWGQVMDWAQGISQEQATALREGEELAKRLDWGKGDQA